MKFRYFLIFKPYGMLSQFTGEVGDALLGELYNFPKDVYPVGRLDKDSEGLLLLTNDNKTKQKLLDPENKMPKTYWVQVDGAITKEAIESLSDGSIIISHKGKKHQVAPAKCKEITAPVLPERSNPVRYRKNIPTSWISLTLTEGKNRQVRKMTAAVGFPTLRLVRAAIAGQNITQMLPGDVIEIDCPL